MMKLDDFKIRLNALIDASVQLMATKRSPEFSRATVDRELFNQFRASGLSLLNSLYGKGHSYYVEFDKNCEVFYLSNALAGIGILKAVKEELDNGWLGSLKSLLSAEIFSDFLEMAEYLLSEGYKDPSAVMIGSVLEEHLRQMCGRHDIPITMLRGDKQLPKKADVLNAELCSKEVYNKLDQKSVTSWLDLRNKAAHGKYNEYTKEQVELMYQGVMNFMSRTS